MLLIIHDPYIITVHYSSFKVYNFSHSDSNYPLAEISLPVDIKKSSNNSSIDDAHDDDDDYDDDDDDDNPLRKDVLKNKQRNQEALNIICGSFSPSGKYLALSDNKKRLFVWRTCDWSIKNRFCIERKCTKVVFDKQENSLLVSDRSGLVYGYCLQANLGEETRAHLLMGHLSMLLDMCFTFDGRFIITCDRDEKIRVSHYPNCYNIKSYCLGHSEFVSSLTFNNDNLLISGGGDSTLFVWDYENGVNLVKIKLTSQRNENIIKKIVTLNNLIAVIFYQQKELRFLEYKDNEFATHKSITLSHEPVDLAVFQEYIVVITLDENELIKCFKIDQQVRNNLIFSTINKDNEFVQNFIKEKANDTYKHLLKQVYNNLEDYLKRKRQREDSEILKKLKR